MLREAPEFLVPRVAALALLAGAPACAKTPTPGTSPPSSAPSATVGDAFATGAGGDTAGDAGGDTAGDAGGGTAVDEAGSAAAAPPAGSAERAEACLASPLCAAVDAARLFVGASDAKEPGLDCFRFLDGLGTGRDPRRARACFERLAGAPDCGGSSAGLDTAELAMMRIDGIGGKTDIAAARALLSDCFDDMTRSGVLEHAAARERDPRAPPVDFCKEIGGTTITMNECMARDSKNADTRRALQAKAVFAGLDDAGRTLFAASEKAYGDYVAAMGAYVYEVYSQGTIRGAMSLGEEQRLRAARAKDLAEFPRFVAKETSVQEVARAERESAAARARISTATAAEGEERDEAQRAWTVYRDAEVSLYQHVYGTKQGADRVRAALLVRLESRRAKECAPPSAGPE
jgi:uncharacterized protein YecT (DUF1311 family)